MRAGGESGEVTVSEGNLEYRAKCSVIARSAVLLNSSRKPPHITDQDVTQNLSQEHTGFSFWVGEPFQDAQRALFVGRYIERGPLSLQKLALNLAVGLLRLIRTFLNEQPS